MLEELQRRNYAKTTIEYYIQGVDRFAKYFRTPPDQLNQGHLRTYQAYLLRERKPGRADGETRRVGAPVLLRESAEAPYMLDDIPFPKVPRWLP
jgi:hypothetical protein